MNNKIKSFLLSIGVGNVYNLLYNWYDCVTCKKIECSIGDILLLRGVPNGSQILMTSRLLDVEAYITKGDDTFLYQNTISREKYGKNHNQIGGNRSFKSLIESYKTNGYMPGSWITCDKEVILMDGNHRMGILLYEKIDRVNVRIVGRKWPDTESLDSYYASHFPSDFLERIIQRYYKIQDWLLDNGVTFCAYIKTDDKGEIDIKKDIRRLCNVLAFKKAKGGGVIAQFSMLKPEYYVKCNQLVSKRALTIEKILKKRTKDSDVLLISKNCMEGKLIFDEYIVKG